MLEGGIVKQLAAAAAAAKEGRSKCKAAFEPSKLDSLEPEEALDFVFDSADAQGHSLALRRLEAVSEKSLFAQLAKVESYGIWRLHECFKWIPSAGEFAMDARVAKRMAIIVERFVPQLKGKVLENCDPRKRFAVESLFAEMLSSATLLYLLAECWADALRIARDCLDNEILSGKPPKGDHRKYTAAKDRYRYQAALAAAALGQKVDSPPKTVERLACPLAFAMVIERAPQAVREAAAYTRVTF